MEFSKLLVVAILIESMWENLKMLYDKKKVNVNMIGSLVLGILVCILAHIDIFAMVGITLAFPVFGWILTGIILSRGANFVNDLFKKIKGD